MTKFVYTFLLVSVLFCAAGAQAASGPTLIDKVVAVVGENIVTLSELQSEMAPPLESIRLKYRGDELARAEKKLKRETLNGLIDKYVQLQEARLIGVEVADEEVDRAVADVVSRNEMTEEQFAEALAGEGFTLKDYKDNLKKQLIILRLVSHAVKSRISITNDEIDEYYEKNAAEFVVPESVRLGNIFFPAAMGDMEVAKDNAQKAREEILAGTPFEDMAVRCTGKPEAKETCVLGEFSRGQLSPEVEADIFAMEEGDLTEPIVVEGGYQLIKVMEKTGGQTLGFEEAKPRIVEKLSIAKGEELFSKWIQELRDRTYVEIRE